MLKKFLLVLSFLGMIPVFAGEVENALAQNKNVFLYLYTPKCGYCVKFDPKYHKLAKMYDKEYTFVKVDASTPYGFNILRQYNGRFVPYVLLLDPANKTVENIPPYCLMDNACTEIALKEFKK